jgi:hypothetical protein
MPLLELVATLFWISLFLSAVIFGLITMREAISES